MNLILFFFVEICRCCIMDILYWCFAADDFSWFSGCVYGFNAVWHYPNEWYGPGVKTIMISHLAANDGNVYLVWSLWIFNVWWFLYPKLSIHFCLLYFLHYFSEEWLHCHMEEIVPPLLFTLLFIFFIFIFFYVSSF